jgi:hypothetical protein
MPQLARDLDHRAALVQEKAREAVAQVVRALELDTGSRERVTPDPRAPPERIALSISLRLCAALRLWR